MGTFSVEGPDCGQIRAFDRQRDSHGPLGLRMEETLRQSPGSEAGGQTGCKAASETRDGTAEQTGNESANETGKQMG